MSRNCNGLLSTYNFGYLQIGAFPLDIIALSAMTEWAVGPDPEWAADFSLYQTEIINLEDIV